MTEGGGSDAMVVQTNEIAKVSYKHNVNGFSYLPYILILELADWFAMIIM